MADRIRPVHSSSRSRTHAPDLQFGRSFNSLRMEVKYHEFVIPNWGKTTPMTGLQESPRWGSRGLGSYHRSDRQASVLVSPLRTLRDSHISSKFPAAKHSPESLQPLHHYDGSWFAVVTSPPAESGAHPTGIGQRPLGMRALLFLGLAFEGLANRLQRGLVVGVECILQWPPSRAITLAHHLQHLNGGDQCRGSQVLERPILGDTHRLDVEPLVFITRNTCSMVQRWR